MLSKFSLSGFLKTTAKITKWLLIISAFVKAFEVFNNEVKQIEASENE